MAKQPTINAAYAKRLAIQKAKAEGLSKKEIAQAGTNAAREFRQNYNQFKSAQNAEIIALKNQGLSAKEINAEKKANTQELKNFASSYIDGTAGTVAGQKLSDFRSAASTYSGDVATNISGLLDTAAGKYTELNIAPKTIIGETKVGVGLDSLVNYELGKASKAVNNLIDRGEKYVGNTFTQDQLNADKVKLKEVKNQPGLYQWVKGDNYSKNIVYFKKNDDGTYTGSGLNRNYTPPPPPPPPSGGGGLFGGGGFLGLGNVGGAIALGALGYFGGPALAGALGTSGALASGVAGGLLGAGTSALTGYDPLKGALAAGSAGAFAGGGGFGGTGGTEVATGAFDSGIGLDAMVGGPGLSVPGTATGAFDAGIGLDAITGGEGLAVPSIPTGAFDSGIGLDAITGGEGLAIPSTPTGAFDAGIGLDVIAPPPTTTVDYSLLGGSNLPPTGVGLETGTGITANLPALPPVESIGVTPIDYASILAPETIPGVVGGIGLQTPTMPNIGAMGGGQGLTVPVEGGTVGELGFTPTGATPSLGDPASFINNPDVLGQPVIQQGTPVSGVSVTDAIRAANAVNSLLNPPQQPTPTQQIGSNTGGMSPTGIDYSGLLSLLATRPQTLGLLGTRFNPYSLIG